MEEKKLFSENISLPQLAGMMKIHPNYLTDYQRKISKNFYNFINSYRVEEFSVDCFGEKQKTNLFCFGPGLWF
jgi:hypothetical protein